MKRLEIKVEEKLTREGKKFNAYKALQKNGKWMDLKFRKEVTPPKTSCFIEVEETKMNIDRNRKYPVLWVSEIAATLPLEVEAKVDESLDEIFG